MKIPKQLLHDKTDVKSKNDNPSDNNIEHVQLNLGDLKNFSYHFSDFDDEKLYKKYIKNCESLIRNSFECKNFLKYIRETQDLTYCKFLTNVDLDKIEKVSIELHHYPFNLFEIVDIIIKKQTNFYTLPTSTFDICNEVMMLHYEGLIGLVPLTKTVHELAHSGQIFINFDLVYGNVKEFIKRYEIFISEDLHNAVSKLNTLSENNNLKTNNYILKRKFQEIVSSANSDLQPIVSVSEEIKLA